MSIVNFASRQNESRDALRELAARHPRFTLAVAADARVTAAYRGERSDFRSGTDTFAQCLRLCLVSDGFLAQAFYRAKAAMQLRRVPLLPRLAHRAAMMIGQVSIGDPVVIQPGVYLVHGQVVIDGITEIGSGTVVSPFVTIGLQAGELQGPKIGDGVQIGTGSRVLGNLSVGDRAVIGANAVVTRDVEADTVVVGIPARPLAASTPAKS